MTINVSPGQGEVKEDSMTTRRSHLDPVLHLQAGRIVADKDDQKLKEARKDIH
jgi:hypothetical protein